VSEPHPVVAGLPAATGEGRDTAVEGPAGTAGPQPGRGWFVFSALVVGLAAVLALVWGLGGFQRRTDLLQVTPPGTTISVGPYELTFTEVTAQRTTGFDDRVTWKVTAVGTGRTTGDESLAPRYSDGATFASKDTRSGVVQEPTGVRYGEARSFTDGAHFTPGLPPVPILVDFSYPDSYRPDATLRFVVFQLEFVDNSLIGDQDPTWNKTNHGFDYRLPVRVLAPATS
jgi:hypothetical protein